ncbi:MAG: SLC13 family permease [Pseudomonadales bacterium]
MNSSLTSGSLWLGPILALAAGLLLLKSGFSWDATITLSVAVICVVWWIFEPIPIPVTSLIPLVALPMSGVLSMEQTSAAYGHYLVLLLLGGFILSTAMEKSGAHLRVALTMVRAFGGTSSRRLVFGFMAASALLSMWISNTATTLMLLPVALAVIEKARDPALPVPLLLGIAYAASVGGIGTPIGTPPNVVFMAIYSEKVGEDISFLTWMTWGVPVVLVLLPIVGLWLTRNLRYSGAVDLPDVGIWKTAERRVMYVFAFTALAWITRSEPFGGWSELFSLSYSNDSMVALTAVVIMFLVPDGKGKKLLDWDTAKKIEWGLLILFGGGIAIAKAFGESGLSESLGQGVSAVSSWHPLAILIAICLCVTFMTEMTSNTATTLLLMPILAAAALAAGMDPRLLMVPAAMSASCAFMLPVATAPNLVVFSTGRFGIDRMVKEGLALNLLGTVVISSLCFFLLA